MNDEINNTGGVLNKDVAALNNTLNTIFLVFGAISTAFFLTALGLLYIG